MSKKPLARERIFVQNTVFSLYFKIRVKTMHAAKPLAFDFLTSKIMKMCEQIRTKTIHATKSLPFSLHSLFRSYQIYYSNLTSKIMKICEQISYLTNSAWPTDQLNNASKKKQAQSFQKVEKQTIKLNNNTLIAKTLTAIAPKANFGPF